MEQHSGPPSTDRSDETGGTGRFARETGEPEPAGRFPRDPDSMSPIVAEPGSERPGDEPTPPEVLPVPDAAEAAEAAPIMSNLPHSRPQQRSQKRAAPKRPASRQASAPKTGRKAASGRAQGGAGAQPRARSKAATDTKRGPGAATPPAPRRDQGLPAQAIGTGVQIATAPLKLTVAVTREAAGLIRRGLRL